MTDPTKDTVVASEESTDAATPARAFRELSLHSALPGVVNRVLALGLEVGGATRVVVALERDGAFRVAGEATPAGVRFHDGGGVPPDARIAAALDEAARTTQPVVRDNGATSIACLPVIDDGQLFGGLYLESSAPEVFTATRMEVFQALALQAAYAIRQVRFLDRLRDEEARARQNEDFAQMVQDIPELHALLDALPQQIFVLRPDMRIQYANNAVRDYHGEELSQVLWDDDIDRRDRILLHPEDLAHLREAGFRAIADGVPLDAECRHLGKDGRYRWFLIRLSPFRDAHGRLLRWYGTRTDIDSRKRAEDALRATQAALAHVARVATLGELTASLAHEVNQPLSGVMVNAATCLRWLAADPPNLDEARDAGRRVIRDAKRANEVIARIRALTTKRQPAFERVDLNDAIREVVALAHGELQRNRILPRLELTDNFPAVLGDRVQLQQVVLNLVMNSIEAMAGLEVERREVLISTRIGDDGFALVAVRDHGVGVDPRTVDRLFEAFYTTKSSGMGMGLSITRSIVASHGGRVWALANDGGGATFQFTIPPHDGTELSTPEASHAGRV